MRRILCVLFSLGLCFGTFAACGNGGDSETIYFYGRGGDEELTIMTQIIQKFTLDTGIEVDYDTVDPNQYAGNLQSKVKNLPDVFYIPDEDFIPYADAGRLLNLDSYIQNSDFEVEDFYTMALDGYRYDKATKTYEDGSLYALPKDLGPYGMVINKTEYKARVNRLSSDKKAKYMDGINYIYPSDMPAMTWEEFSQFLSDMTYTSGNTKYYGISSYETSAAVYSNNADFLSADGKTALPEITAFSDAFQYVVDLSTAHKVAPNYQEQAARNGYVRFVSGETVVGWMGPWDCTAFWNMVDFEWDLMPIPFGPGADKVYETEDDGKSCAFIGSMGLAISNASKKKDSAFKLIEYITSDKQAQKLAYQLGQGIPNLKSMQADYINAVGLEGKKTQPANKAEFIKIIETNGKRRPKAYTYSNNWYDDYLFGANNTDIGKMWSGEKTARDVFASSKNSIQSALNLSLKQWGK